MATRCEGLRVLISRVAERTVFSGTLVTALVLLVIWNVASVPAFAVSDGLAQFGPVSVLAAKAILSGNFPLFNFYQFLGHPLLEVGYYPAIYPLTPAAYLLSLALPGGAQHMWSVLCSLQVLFNTGCCYLCFRRCFAVPPILASVGALSVAFCGLALLQGGEWFYSLTVYGFVPLVWYCTFRCRTARGLSWPLLIGVAVSVFVWGSNVQYVFYAAHFMAVMALGWLLGGATERRTALLRFAIAAVVTGALIAPYFAIIQSHVGGSIREIGTVSIEKYFWLTLDPWSVMRASAWPIGGLEPHDALRPLAANYIGLIPALGILIAPYALFVIFRSRRAEFFPVIALVVMTLSAFLLAIGPSGGIGYVLYQLPVYNWFRHSIKWGSFFQLSSVFLGIVAISSCLEAHRRLRLRRTWIEGGAWLLTVGLLISQVATFDQRLRLTGDTLPLPEPVIGFEPSARHTAIWHPGGEWNYQGDLTKSLLAFNYLSFFELPGLLGYEPQILRRNFEVVGHHFFPGFFQGAEAVDLAYLQRWGVRFIRLPKHGADAALEILRARFPGVLLLDRGVDSSLGVRVVELPEARPLVFGKGIHVRTLRIGPAGVIATLHAANNRSRLTFNWLANEGFAITLDGSPVPWRADVHNRPVIAVEGSGPHSVHLRYGPRWMERATWLSIALTFGAFAIAVALSGRRMRRRKTAIV
jgi:hypothetical protein